MTERGPDSAGLAVFTEPVGGRARKFSLYCGSGERRLGGVRSRRRMRAFGADTARQRAGNHAVLKRRRRPTR